MCVLGLVVSSWSQATTSVIAAETLAQGFLNKYCSDCHDADTKKGDLRLDNIKSLSEDPATAPLWLTILDRVSAHEMPPPKKKTQPSESEIARFAKPLEKELTIAKDEQIKREGRVVWRRLNRVEYENTVRDLLALPYLDIKEDLPPDPAAHGFDNVSEAQDISYVQMGRYMEAAEKALKAATILYPKPPAQVLTYPFDKQGRFKKYGRDGDAVIFAGESYPGQAPHFLTLKKFDEPGEYTFRIRCRSAEMMDTDSKGTKLAPPKSNHVAALRVREGRYLPYFDVPDEYGVVEFSDYTTGTEAMTFNCSSLSGGRKFGDKPVIMVDWLEIEGPMHNRWPPESYQRLYGDLPICLGPVPVKPCRLMI
jgi:hypothetical protein